MRTSATLLLVFVAGCGLLGKKDDPGGETPGAIDAAAIVVVPGTPVGSNVAAVARFATEVPLNEPKMIGQTATPRTSPGGGSVVATLPKNTIVTRIATNSTASRIVFPNPANVSDNLMGWVTEAAFSAAVVPRVDAGVVVVVDAGVAVVDAGPPAVVDAGAAWTATKCAKANNMAVKLPGGGAWACRHLCAKDTECTAKTKKCEQLDVHNPEPGKPTTAKVCHDDQ